MHAPLKRLYREKEMELMLNKLKSDPKQIPSPSRGEMVEMLCSSSQSLEVGVKKAFKFLWVTNALDGTEDHIVSDKLMSLVGKELISYRNDLIKGRSLKPCVN